MERAANGDVRKAWGQKMSQAITSTHSKSDPLFKWFLVGAWFLFFVHLVLAMTKEVS